MQVASALTSVFYPFIIMSGRPAQAKEGGERAAGVGGGGVVRRAGGGRGEEGGREGRGKGGA